MTEFSYGVYGVSLRSEIPLALPEAAEPGFAQIHLRTAPPETFSTAIAGSELVHRADWYQYAHLQDGSSYARWRGLGEFLVSPNGSRILCRPFPGAHPESFQVYLLGQALGFALVKAGFEPLHGTAIVSGDSAIALLGDSGFGKSTLAASFLDSGCTLLTDDVLLLHGNLAYPGPPRIKLFPDAARRYLKSEAAGVPMNSETQKHVIPLSGARRCVRAVELRAIYVLAEPAEMRRRRRVSIEPLTPREAFIALIANTFNRYIHDAGRLRRQMAEVTRLVRSVPVCRLSYPRSLARLSEVRESILGDRGAQFSVPPGLQPGLQIEAISA